MKPVFPIRSGLTCFLWPLISVVFHLSATSHGQGVKEDDFFDLIGQPPAEVATSITAGLPYSDMPQLLSGFVGLPMSAEHRDEFLKRLRSTFPAPDRWQEHSARCLLNLLEEDGRHEDALALIRAQSQKSSLGHVREVCLLWKSGKVSEAAELADRDPGVYIRDDDWLSLVNIDMIKNRPDEAMRLLDFLDHRPGFPAQLRYALAIQHLEIARPAGKVDELIGQSTSPVLQAVWNSALDRKEQARENLKAAGPGLTAGDLELLLLAVGTTDPLLVELAKAMLATGDLTLEQRRSLLKRFRQTPLINELWSAMGSGHGETVDLLKVAPWSIPLTEIPKFRQTCLKILKAHPGDARLKLLAARLSSGEPDGGRSLFLEAAQAVQENPKGFSQFADPAESALAELVKKVEPAELRKLLLEAPGFDPLPPEDKLRYLMTANLDPEVVKILPLCKFDQPSQDFRAEDLRVYFVRRSYDHVIPAEVVAMLWDRFPEILLGSPSKPVRQITDNIGSWFRLLGSLSAPEAVQANAVIRLVAAAGVRSPELQQSVLRLLPDFIWSLPGLNFSRPAPPDVARPAVIPPVFAWLTVFSPPVYGYVTRNRAQDRFPPTHSGMRLGSPGDSSYLVLTNSPWAQNLLRAAEPDPLTPVVQAKLRKLFVSSPSRTIIYDLLVTAGELNCPDAQVMAAVEERIAGIGTTPQDDPAIAAYRFLVRLAKGEAPDKAASALDGIDQFSSQARDRVWETLTRIDQYRQRTPVATEQIREKFGFAKFVESPPNPPSVSDRLRFLKESKKLNSPEAIALAREALFKFTDSKKAAIESEQNISIRTLVTAGVFQAFLEDLKSRMVAAGSSELDLQRALYRVHFDRFVHSKGEKYPYAKRVLELDPNDIQAAADVLEAATLENNRPLALSCLATLCRQSRTLLLDMLTASKSNSNPAPKVTPLGLFTGPQAHELADALLRVPLQAREAGAYVDSTERSHEAECLYILYYFFAAHDADSFVPLFRWAGGLTGSNGEALIKLSFMLKRTQREDLAVKFLADAYFTPPAGESTDTLQFQPSIVQVLPQYEAMSLSSLAQDGMLKPLAEAASSYPESPATAGIRLLIALGADPLPETWNRLAPKFLASLQIARREEIQKQLELHIQSLPGSTALRSFLANQKKPTPEKPPVLSDIMTKLALAAKANDPMPVSELWQSARKILTSGRDPNLAIFISSATANLAALADDSVWSEFLEFAGKADGFAEKWIQNNSGSRFESIPLKRAADLAKLTVLKLTPTERALPAALGFFDRMAAADSPNTAMLLEFRPWLEMQGSANERSSRISARLQFLDLISSNIDAVSPQLLARPQQDLSWMVDWSLAGYNEVRSGYPFAGKLGFLDGRFDLEILAGPDPDRLVGIAKVEKAFCTGRLQVKIPATAKFISLLAKQRDGSIVRWSHPIRLEVPPFSTPLEINPDNLGPGNRLTMLPAAGIFSQNDAAEITVTTGKDVELAKLPWTGGPAPIVSGWISSQSSGGSLVLRFLTGDDVELATQRLETSDSEVGQMPFWQRIKTPRDVNLPPETEKIVLAGKSYYSGRPWNFRVSDLRVVPNQAPPSADGFTLLGRVPNQVNWIAMDPQGNRFVTCASTTGVGVFDLTTSGFSGWIPLGPSRKDQSWNIVWMAMAGDRIVCALQTGEVYLISVSKRSAKVVRNIGSIPESQEIPDSIALSPDGNLLAWPGKMAGIRLAKITDDGIAAERLIETGQIQSLKFDAEKKVLQASDDSNDYSLPIDDWEKGSLKITNGLGLRVDFEHTLPFHYRAEISLVDKEYGVTFKIDPTVDLTAEMDPKNRTLKLPPGLVALDHEGHPFFISADGKVMRIETPKVKGYTPLPGK
jgi:hypothetical protein